MRISTTTSLAGSIVIRSESKIGRQGQHVERERLGQKGEEEEREGGGQRQR